ncbi:MAG TPA: SDR family NAD(P)-dependent oxidoreductase [Candidatus Rifleibacterium sp.]|nr:SDR family NAD(P)-dependent oxidoreductase [Candidatus Rifleibacterium sp.]
MKRTKQKFEPLAIVGMSCLYPKAQTVEDYWANIKEKVDAITEVPPTHWNASDYFDADKKRPDHVYTTTGGFLDPVDFNPGEWGIAPSDLDSIDTSQLLSLVVAQGALVDAGYHAGRDFNRDNVSVILGLTGTLELVVPLGARLGHPIWRRAMQHAGIAPEITEEVIKSIGKAYVGWQENSFPGLLGNVAAGRVANRLNLGGTNCVVDAACGSSLSAVNLAAMELWTGKTDMAITGGVDTFNDIFMYMCFCKTPALSPTGHARPFSVDNDGTILGEGIGMVVIKRLSDAERDGDRIYACINAVGSSSDGKGKAIYAPSADGQQKALRRAYEQAGITPRDISLIEAHGTGTGAGDEVEVNALKEIYGTAAHDRPWCALGSVKSQIGHTKAAAGSAGLIKAALALHHKVIPPTIKVTQPAKALATAGVPFYLPDQLRPWLTEADQPRYAAVSALGFGGSNYHVVLSEYTENKTTWDWQRGTELFTLSGKSAGDLKTALTGIGNLKDAKALRQAAAGSRSSFNAKDPCRLTFVVEAGADLAKLAGELSAQLDRTTDGKGFSLPNGACFSQQNEAKPIGIIFPGQGAQYPGMGRDLVCAGPEAFTVLAESTREIGALDEAGNLLHDYIFPRPTYNPENDKLNEERLRSTDIAQPAIGAIALGHYKALEAFGVEANCFAGHSYGELVSLCAAGAFDTQTLAKLSRKRGQLMAQGSGDRGGMIAVAAERTAVEAVIAEEKLQLVVANHNSPQQVVLSGPTAEIERSKTVFKNRKLRATILNVAGAFHSSLVADAAEPFHAFLAGEKFGKLKCPVYANTTAEVYPGKPEAAKKLLGFQLANQVRFVEIIEKMYADGIRTFIEAGPGGKMAGLIKAILEGRDCNVIAVDSSAGKRSALTDLARALAQLAALGYEIKLKDWRNGEQWLASLPPAGKPKLTFPVCGANYKNKAQLQALADLAKPVTARPAPVAPMAAPARPAAPVAQAAPTAQVATTPTAVAARTPAPVTQAAAPLAASQPRAAMPAIAGYTNNSETSMKPANLETLKLSRETLSALQQLQQQTADLHRRFLEGQDQAQKTIMALITGSASLSTNSPQPATTWNAPATAQPVIAYTTPVMAMPATPAPAPAQARAVVSPTPVALAPVARPQVTAPAPVAAKPAVDAGRVRTILLEVVSEKTGYPVEMLNPEMDMEADLGIDSIKRVEIMSAMQERLPEAPVVQPDQLGKLRTLSQILEHLSAAASSNAGPASTGSAAGKVGGAASQARPAANIQPVLLDVVSEKTGYPVEMLNLDMDMEADLGIDSIKRVEIMSAMQERLPEAPVVQPDQLGKLRTLAQILEHLGNSSQAAPVATAHAAPAPVARPAAASNSVKPVLIEIVSDKTGYPVEMLNLDMDMEADLGIDSIKRVEIMSAVQERLPNAPVIQPDQLGKLRTLAQIIEFIGGSAADAPAQGNTGNAVAPTASQAPAASSGNIDAVLLEVIADKTGYPTDMLNPDMDMEADLGIDSIKRVEILSAFQERVPDAPVVQPGDLGKFRTIAQILGYLKAAGAPASAAPAQAPLATPQVASTTPAATACPIRRTILKAVELPAEPAGRTVLHDGDRVIITSDDVELADAVISNFAVQGIAAEKRGLTELAAKGVDENCKGLIILAPVPEKATMNLWESQSEEWLKDVFMAVQKAGSVLKKNSGLVATVARLDGSFGLESITRTVDPVQGGLAGLIKTIRYEWPEVTPRAIDLDYRFKNNDDAAGRLTAELICHGPVETGLTRSCRYSIEEVVAPLSENTETPANFQKGDVVIVTGGARGVTAETAIAFAARYQTTMVLIGRSPVPEQEPAWLAGLTEEPAIKGAILKNSGRKLTPKELEGEFRNLMAAREVRQNLERIRQTGGRVFYHSADIRNAEETEKVIELARSEAGQITGIIHGAGVLRDRRIEDKTRDQLDDVIDTKVAGLRNVLKSVIKDNLKAVVLFSSFSGRGGRLGQVDYAMANEVLNKVAQKLRILRPECRVMAFNWGPWDGGMVTPALRNVFIAEGIGLIPLREGARQPVIELSHPAENAVEIGIMGTLEEQGAPEPGKKFVKAFDFDLNVKENVWLKDHVLNGDPVLPMAVAAELMSQGALMRNPGLQFTGYDEMRILKGVVLKSPQATLSIFATAPVKGADGYRVTCEIRTGNAGRETVNARAEVLLADRLPAAVPAPEKTDARLVYPDSINEAYNQHLFHGGFFNSLTAIEGWSERGIIAVCKSSQPPAAWFARPPLGSWCSDPLAIDAAYQLMILWTTQACGAPSLPGYARHYRQYVTSFKGADVVLVARARRQGAMMASADIDFVDANGRLLARIEGYESTLNENLKNAFKLRTLNGAA